MKPTDATGVASPPLFCSEVRARGQLEGQRWARSPGSRKSSRFQRICTATNAVYGSATLARCPNTDCVWAASGAVASTCKGATLFAQGSQRARCSRCSSGRASEARRTMRYGFLFSNLSPSTARLESAQFRVKWVLMRDTNQHYHCAAAFSRKSRSPVGALRVVKVGWQSTPRAMTLKIA